MPTWDRQKTGIEGLEQDVTAVYAWVRDELATFRTWMINEIGRITEKMATFKEAVDDALSEFDDLSAQLQAAIAANDAGAVQAQADRLESAVQALRAAHQAAPEAPADPVDPSAPSA